MLAPWEADRRLFSVTREAAPLYPAYGFADDWTPLTVIADVWRVLGHFDDPIRLAMWFESTSSYLGGARPRELVCSHPESVRAAAENRLHDETYGG